MYTITAPALAITLLSFLFLFIRISKHSKGSDSTEILRRRSLWYIGSPGFFLRPPYYVLETLKRARNSAAAFTVKGNLVIIIRGLAGRDAFFSKGLDFVSGYKLLNPQLVDIIPTKEIGAGVTFANFIGNFVRSEVLDKTLPTLAEDVSRIIDNNWGNKGKINPFDDIYELVFAMSCRLTTCREFCEDPKKMHKLMDIFKRLEKGSTPAALILPWVPTPARVNRFIAGAQLYKMCSDVVEARRREGRREDDPLQSLMDKQYSIAEITRFMAISLFGAVTNAGNVMGWILIYLETNPTWKSRVQNEIDNFVRHNRGSSSQPSTASIISQVALEQMEAETPDIELVINETLRMIFVGTFMRRNLGDDMFVDGARIKRGAFLMFPVHDLHFDPVLFPQPCKFDPLRFTTEAVEERQKQGINFLGWGATRHICPGKRAALVMIRIVLISIMGRFDSEIVDQKGFKIYNTPEAYYSVLFKICPPAPKDRVYLSYRDKALSA